MKKTGRKLLSAMLCGILLVSCALLMGGASPCEKYIYPITPTKNPDEWRKLSSHVEMLEVCEIPETILKKLSTKQLLLTCLDYPLAVDMIFYQDAQIGFEVVKDRFNGLCELYQRRDFSKTLSDYYSSLEAAGLETKDSEAYLRNIFLKAVTVYAIRENKLAEEDILSVANSCYRLVSELPDGSEVYSIYENLYLELRKAYREG